ncbi:hypothetical protein C7M84_006264 [Penaeus vannamei]|uniref:Uncharacterized protein n=1 Tax=Penaeus vannamei TaxID=6689 RepID=A0A3R7PKY8_PENVA|nr:hypothetical protein C7M84_006264 [Penaeus vannamei]
MPRRVQLDLSRPQEEPCAMVSSPHEDVLHRLQRNRSRPRAQPPIGRATRHTTTSRLSSSSHISDSLSRTSPHTTSSPSPRPHDLTLIARPPSRPQSTRHRSEPFDGHRPWRHSPPRPQRTHRRLRNDTKRLSLHPCAATRSQRPPLSPSPGLHRISARSPFVPYWLSVVRAGTTAPQRTPVQDPHSCTDTPPQRSTSLSPPSCHHVPHVGHHASTRGVSRNCQPLHRKAAPSAVPLTTSRYRQPPHTTPYSPFPHTSPSPRPTRPSAIRPAPLRPPLSALSPRRLAYRCPHNDTPLSPQPPTRLLDRPPIYDLRHRPPSPHTSAIAPSPHDLRYRPAHTTCAIAPSPHDLRHRPIPHDHPVRPPSHTTPHRQPHHTTSAIASPHTTSAIARPPHTTSAIARPPPHDLRYPLSIPHPSPHDRHGPDRHTTPSANRQPHKRPPLSPAPHTTSAIAPSPHAPRYRPPPKTTSAIAPCHPRRRLPAAGHTERGHSLTDLIDAQQHRIPLGTAAGHARATSVK